MSKSILDEIEEPVDAEALGREVIELRKRVAKLERGYRLAKVHFGNGWPTKAERALDEAMGGK